MSDELAKIRQLMQKLQESVVDSELECKRSDQSPVWTITLTDKWPPDSHYEASADFTQAALIEFETDKLAELVMEKLVKDYHKIKK